MSKFPPCGLIENMSSYRDLYVSLYVSDGEMDGKPVGTNFFKSQKSENATNHEKFYDGTTSHCIHFRTIKSKLQASANKCCWWKVIDIVQEVLV